MAQSEEGLTQLINEVLKIDYRGWNIALFEDKIKISNYLCTHCDSVCCDAVELGCDHNDEDDIFIYCKICLSGLVKDNDNKCMISGHSNPPLDAARSIRRKILKSMVSCPYSLAFKIRNNLKKNKNNNAEITQISDTLGNDEKEGAQCIAAPGNDEKRLQMCDRMCDWKGVLPELINKHIIECAKRNDPAFALNIKIKQLQNENVSLKQRIENLENKQKELNHKNEEIKQLRNENKNLTNEINKLKTNNEKQLNDINNENNKLKEIIIKINQEVEITTSVHVTKPKIIENANTTEVEISNESLIIEEKEEKYQHLSTNLSEKDIFKGNKKCIINLNNLNNLLFTTKGSKSYSGVYTYAIIQKEWNNGTHHIKLKCIQSARNGISIGMVTNNKIKTTKLLFYSKKCGISYQLYVDLNTTKIDLHKNGKQEYSKTIPNRKPISDKWTCNTYEPNETMEMKVDFNKNELIFYRNDKQMGNIIKIESNTYYPAIAYDVNNGCFSKYGPLKIQLLSLY